MRHPPLDPDDLPADPDRDDVPEELLEHEGEMVLVWVDGQPPTREVLVIVPQLYGDARRLAEGDMPPGPSAN